MQPRSDTTPAFATSRRVALATSAVVALAVLAGGAALAAAKPRLTPAKVDRIAIRAAQPYDTANNGQPGGPITVVSTHPVRRGHKITWFVRVHAPLFVFRCPGDQTPTCPAYPTQYALVRIADATARVLSVAALPTGPSP